MSILPSFNVQTCDSEPYFENTFLRPNPLPRRLASGKKTDDSPRPEPRSPEPKITPRVILVQSGSFGWRVFSRNPVHAEVSAASIKRKFQLSIEGHTPPF